MRDPVDAPPRPPGSGTHPEERDRRVICRTHGLRYDPYVETGCPTCRRDPAAEGEQESGRRRGLWALTACALLVIGTLFVHRSGGDASERVSEAQSHPRMEAYPYRKFIEKIEWILYRDGSPAREDAEQIRVWSGRLADHMKEWESRLYMTPNISKLREFGEWAKSTYGARFDERALRETRARWEQLRAEVFEPADWFQR